MRWVVAASAVAVFGLAACMSDDTYVPMTAAVAPATLDQATVLPVNAMAHQQRAGRPQGLVPPLFPGGSVSIVLRPLRTEFVTDERGNMVPDGRPDDYGSATFGSMAHGTRLAGALVASACRIAADDPSVAGVAGRIQYDLKSGAASSNRNQQCTAVTSDYTQLGANYSWTSTASWSGGILTLSGRATVIRSNSRLSANDAEHLDVEEKAVLRISEGNCTLVSYRLVERKSRPNSAFFTHLTHIATEQPLPGATCGFN